MRNISFLLSLLAALSSAACIAPPPGATAPPAATAEPTGAAGPSATPDLSKPLIVWNGDDVSPTAKAWECKPPCPASFEPKPGVGANGSTGLEFRVNVKEGYAGSGWNWTSWYKGGAADITGRKALKFKIQIIPKTAEVAPSLDGLNIALRCAKSDNCGKIASLQKYAPNAMDGAWHDVAIPLVDMKTEKKDEWDDKSVWELDIHNWAPTPREFVAHLDDIGFE